MASPPDLTLTLSFPVALDATPYGPIPDVNPSTQIVGWTTTPYLPRVPLQPDFVRVPK